LLEVVVACSELDLMHIKGERNSFGIISNLAHLLLPVSARNNKLMIDLFSDRKVIIFQMASETFSFGGCYSFVFPQGLFPVRCQNWWCRKGGPRCRLPKINKGLFSKAKQKQKAR